MFLWNPRFLECLQEFKLTLEGEILHNIIFPLYMPIFKITLFMMLYD